MQDGHSKLLRWRGFSSEDRNIAIHHIEHIINRHGYIVDFKFFSDMAVSFYIEVEERKVLALYTDLKLYLTLDDFEAGESDSSRDDTILFNVTFTHSKGNLESIIPEVPG